MRWRTIWTIFVIMLVVAFGLVVAWDRFGTNPAPAANDAPRPVAAVNGVLITQPMVDRELTVSRFNVAEPLPPLSGDDLERAREEALNQLISRQLILQAAVRQGFTLDESFIKKRAELLFGSPNEAAFQQALEQANITYDDVLWWVGQIITVEEFTTQVVMAEAAPEERQQVYNEWFNQQRAKAQITYPEGQPQAAQALVGEPAPNFTLATPAGQPVSLADYSGRVVLVNFWATWCPSCISEMPEYEQVYQQKAPEFVVLGVNLQEGAGHVQQYADGLGVTFPVLLDEDGRVTTGQYQVTGMPGSFIIDRQGKIFYRHLGPMNIDTLTAKLAELGL